MEDELQEMIKEKRTKREAIMSKKEIELADKYLMWYRKAYSDKQKLNLFKKWEEAEKYWEGDFEYENDDDPAPNTNITNSNVEGKTALLCDQTIAIQVDPREPGDRPFCNMARTLADFIKERNKMYRKIEVHERRRELFGSGIFKVFWDFDELEGKGLPIIEPIHPSRLFIDPSITDVYKIQKAQYIIEASNRSIYSAYENYGKELAECIIPNLDPISNVLEESEEDQYVHLMIWTRYITKDGEKHLRLVEMSGDGVILKDTKEKVEEYNKKKEEEVELKRAELIKKKKNKKAKELKADKLRLFPNTKYPYFMTPDMYRENTIWGKASAELMIPISDQIDEIDDNILRNGRLTGNPISLISNSSGIDPGKITNVPGQQIPTNDINGIRWLQPPNMPTYLLEKRNSLMNNDRQIVGRFTDQMIGKQQSGVDTATESLALQNSGNAMISHKKGLLQETLSEVFEYALELALLNWNTTMLFRITGKNGEDDFEEFNPDKLNNIPKLIESDTDYREKYRKKWKERYPNKDINELNPDEYKYMQVDNETRKIEYDLTVSVGAGLPSNPAYRYSLVRQSYNDKVITRREYRNYIIKTAGMNIPEIPESQAEQQEIGILEEKTPTEIQQEEINNQITMPNANIEGLTQNGNPGINYMRKGAI